MAQPKAHETVARAIFSLALVHEMDLTELLRQSLGGRKPGRRSRKAA